jgi:hypothetical protein
MTPKRRDIRDAIPPTKDALKRGAPVDSVLAELRANGYSPAASSHILANAASMPFGEAKAAVFNSPVWGDERDSWARAQEQAETALRVTAEGRPKPKPR